MSLDETANAEPAQRTLKEKISGFKKKKNENDKNLLKYVVFGIS